MDIVRGPMPSTFNPAFLLNGTAVLASLGSSHAENAKLTRRRNRDDKNKSTAGLGAEFSFPG